MKTRTFQIHATRGITATILDLSMRVEIQETALVLYAWRHSADPTHADHIAQNEIVMKVVYLTIQQQMQLCLMDPVPVIVEVTNLEIDNALEKWDTLYLREKHEYELVSVNSAYRLYPHPDARLLAEVRDANGVIYGIKIYTTSEYGGKVTAYGEVGLPLPVDGTDESFDYHRWRMWHVTVNGDPLKGMEALWQHVRDLLSRGDYNLGSALEQRQYELGFTGATQANAPHYVWQRGNKFILYQAGMFNRWGETMPLEKFRDRESAEQAAQRANK